MEPGFGAFGKMPALGDFFRLNLPRVFVDAWDGWLQAGIGTLRDRMGGAWDGCYLSAPIWRFSLPRGQVGDAAMVGVMMPSVDRVGRQFPLTLACPVELATPAETHFLNAPLFDRLEHLALETLDDAMTRDQLQTRLTDLPAPVIRAPEPHLQYHPGGLTLSAQAPLQALLARQSLPDAALSRGMWSMILDGDHRILSCDGLPNTPQMQALFDLQAPLWTPLPQEAQA